MLCIAADVGHNIKGSALTKLTGQGGDLETIIQDIGAAVSTLKISPSQTIIVGHSMGGIVAPEATLRYQFAGTVLLGPVYPNEGLGKVLEDRIQKVQQSKHKNTHKTILRVNLMIGDLLNMLTALRWHGRFSRCYTKGRNSIFSHCTTTSIHPYSSSRSISRGLHCKL